MRRRNGMLIPLWQAGYEAKGPGRALLLRAVRRRLAETAGLGDGFFEPCTELLILGGRPFLSTPGRPPALERFGRRGTSLTLADRLGLAASLVRTAARFEEEGILLGTLRPETLSCGEGRFWLEDPFLAALLLPHRPDWRFFPDPCFQAPEILRGAGPSAAGDRFALGAAIYWLFTGRPPFIDEDERYISLRVLREEPIDPRHYLPPLPAEAAGAAMALLAKDPARRPAPAEVLPSFTVRTAPPEEARRWCRARARLPVSRRPREGRRVLWPAVPAVLFLLAGFLFLLQARRPSPSSARAAETVLVRFYRARSEGGRPALLPFLLPGSPPPPWPEGAAAVWDRVREVELRRVPGRTTMEAVVRLEEAAFVRGEIARWSGIEVVRLAIYGGEWRIAAVNRAER